MSTPRDRRRPVLMPLLALLMLLGAAALPTMATADQGLEVRVTAPATTVMAQQPVRVRVTMSNPTTHAITLPVWDTPARGVDAPIFTVTHAGVAVPYVGMIAKRAAPDASQLVTIAAGGSVAYDAVISGAYAFTASGTYTVRYDVPELGITSPPATIDVEGRTNALGLRHPGPATQAGIQSVTTTGCDAGEQTAVTAALGAAGTYAQGAVDYFTANRGGSRYQHWFGTYGRGRWTAVADHYTRIANAAATASVQFVCHDPGCGPDSDGTYAFVYRNQPYIIYVCVSFWAAGLTGTDSRAGTLVHEMSHFTVLADTQDWVYGQSGAHSLAGSDPAKAVDNADNHEYFAENTPATPDNAAAYTLSATSQDLGSHLVGTPTAGTSIVLTSTGDTSLSLGTLAITGADFALVSDTCSGAALAPSASCTLDVQFTPSVAGGRTGAITIPGNAIAAPGTIALSGTGTAPDNAPAAPDTPASSPTAAPAPTPLPEAAPALPTVPLAAPLRASASCGGRGNCAITGTLPPTATRVVVRAARKGRTARGTCTVAKGTRAYRCGITLGAGTWSVTTDAIGPSGIVASSTVTKVVRARR